MELILFASKKAEFKTSPLLKAFNGIINGIEEFSFQPIGGLPTTRNENSPLKNSAEIRIRLITEFINSDKQTLLTFISESSCKILFENPENEKQIFMEFTEKALSEHRKIFDSEKSSSGLGFQIIREATNEEKGIICKQLISHFRTIF